MLSLPNNHVLILHTPRYMKRILKNYLFRKNISYYFSTIHPAKKMNFNNPLFLLLAITSFMAILYPSSGRMNSRSRGSANLVCGPNEIVFRCSNKCGEPRCDDPKGKMCTKNCEGAACECIKGYARNAKEQCILVADCPKKSEEESDQKDSSSAEDLVCGPHESVNSCGNRCEPRCDDPPEGIACVKMCYPPACACDEGYARNAQDKCVLVKDCPKNSEESGHKDSSSAEDLVCGPNETVFVCSNKCSEPRCDDPPKGKFCNANCEGAACECIKGYARNAEDQCVLKADCPFDYSLIPAGLCSNDDCPPGSDCHLTECDSGECPTICVPKIIED